METVAAQSIGAATASGPTPRRIFLERVARERLDHVAHLRDLVCRAPVDVIASYSFKTNPRRELITLARAAGFLAETISYDEIAWAYRNGFAPNETIHNGPEPLVRTPRGGPLAIVFADSVEAFARNERLGVAELDGVRLRPSMIASRFGVPLADEPELRAALMTARPAAPLGVSFHVRHEDFRGASWRDVADDVVRRAAALERDTERRVVAFDVGGGWTPQQFDASFTADMGWLVDRLRASLPACTRLFFEPGQAVCTPAEALLTEVREVRTRRGGREVIVDLGYSDWPQMHEYAHGIFTWRYDRWERVGPGPDRFGGRTCLEYDVVEGLQFPPDISAGDRLLVTDTGSYDHSMAFGFARGEPEAAQ